MSTFASVPIVLLASVLCSYALQIRSSQWEERAAQKPRCSASETEGATYE